MCGRIDRASAAFGRLDMAFNPGDAAGELAANFDRMNAINASRSLGVHES
jgi:hypothetical protein